MDVRKSERVRQFGPIFRFLSTVEENTRHFLSPFAIFEPYIWR